MKFSRRATYQDLDKETERWTMILTHKTRELLKNGEGIEGRKRIRDEIQCSLREAVEIEDKYLKYWNALKDFHEGKEVFVEY